MSKAAISSSLQAEQFQISPEYTRISMAAAIELGLKPGRLYRDVRCGCINLLQNYPEGCYANCTYCGLARERPGIPEDNSFIRVAWPLVPTDLVAEKIAEREAEVGVGRVCIAQVQDHRSNADLLDMTKRVHRAAPAVPISGLLNATTTTDDLLLELKMYGVDKIGFGLDAASEEIFYTVRGRGTRGPHTWEQHWDRIRLARRLYGPMNINCHVIVGLGETDCDLIKLFFELKAEQIEAYVFSFNSEPGTTMQHVSRQPIKRHRRVQLAKHLIETTDLPDSAFMCNEEGMLTYIAAPLRMIEDAIAAGVGFMTDGCPDRGGEMCCNRPYGSYRPGEEFREYPFLPNADDVRVIREQIAVEELLTSDATVS